MRTVRPLLSRYQVWIGSVISILLLFLSFRGIGWDQLSSVLTKADWFLVFVAVVTVLLTTVAKAGRWWLLFYPRQGHLRYHKLLSILFIGQMINIVVPARLGEVARLYFIGEIEGISRARTLGTIALEKLVDLLMIPVVLAVLVFMIPLPAWMQTSGAQAMLIGGGGVLTLLIVLAQRQRILRLIAWGLDWLPATLSRRVTSQLELGFSGVEALRHPCVVLALLGGSVGIWILSATTNYLVFAAVGLELPFSAAVFLLLVLQVGVAVPSTPGKLGVFHYLCILGLSVFGVGQAPALGYALLLHAVVFVPLSIAGAVGLWWQNLSIRRVRAITLEPE